MSTTSQPPNWQARSHYILPLPAAPPPTANPTAHKLIQTPALRLQAIAAVHEENHENRAQ